MRVLTVQTVPARGDTASNASRCASRGTLRGHPGAGGEAHACRQTHKHHSGPGPRGSGLPGALMCWHVGEGTIVRADGCTSLLAWAVVFSSSPPLPLSRFFAPHEVTRERGRQVRLCGLPCPAGQARTADTEALAVLAQIVFPCETESGWGEEPLPAPGHAQGFSESLQRR